jgi:uncharacterized RDD family membrane protein YckC
MSLPPPLPAANPYAAPMARVDEYAPQELVLADRGTRLLAAIVDGLILGGIVILIAVLVPAVTSTRNGAPNETAAALIGIIGGLAFLAVLIVNMVMLHRHGQTIAKRMFNIKILRADGTPCSLVRVIFARWLPVTLLGAIPLIGWIFSLLDPLLIFRTDQRCLHDLIAETIVVKA